MKDHDSLEYTRYTSKMEFEKAIHTLEGLMAGIAIDGIIEKSELEELSAWCFSNYQYIDRQPYKELIPYIQEAISDDYLDEEEQQNILWFCKQFKTENEYYDVITSDIQRLQGIMHGILSNNHISTAEIQNLEKWLDQNTHLAGVYPYDELQSMIMCVLADGIVDEQEEKQLKVFFYDYIIPAERGSINQAEIEEYKKTISLSGVCAVCPEIILDNHYFCFTGKSSRTKRSDFVNTVSKYDGKYLNNVTGKLDYLIIGDNGNPCWAYSCYGRKVEQVLQKRKEGASIIIAHETDFWDAVEDLV